MNQKREDRLQRTRDRIYRYLREYILENHRSPTIKEIKAAVGLKSTSTTHTRLGEMRKAGRINFEDGQYRSITVPDIVMIDAAELAALREAAAGQCPHCSKTTVLATSTPNDKQFILAPEAV